VVTLDKQEEEASERELHFFFSLVNKGIQWKEDENDLYATTNKTCHLVQIDACSLCMLLL